MPARLTLIAHASTESVRKAAFAIDDPLDELGTSRASAAPRPTQVRASLCSPGLAASQTASLLGLVPEVTDALREWDLGRWAGRTLEDVATIEPDAVTTWLTDPNAAPHEGETLDALLDRIASWLEEPVAEGHVVAVANPAVLRAALVHVLGAPPSAFWRIDVPPLGRLVLSGRIGMPMLWSVKRFDVLA
jgi:broad specificity phosphatase PhoE